MKRFRLLLWIALLSLFLAACDTGGLYRFTLVTDGKHIFDQGVTGSLILTNGAAVLPAGTTLGGSAHILSGKLTVEGHITGDVFFLNGDLVLGPTARIDGDLNLGDGSYRPAPDAVIAGKVNTGTGIPLPDLPAQQAPSMWIVLLRTLVGGSLLGLVAAVLARYAPGAVRRVGEAGARHSLVSAAMGLLVGIVGISLLVTLAYTILLIPVTLLGLFLLVVAVLYGWIALGVRVGRLGSRLLKRPVAPSLAAFSGTAFTVLVLTLLSSLPWIGGLLGLASASIGLGAVSLTRFGLQRFTPSTPETLST